MPRTISPMYVQCRIEGSGKNQTVFIPEEYGVKGNVFKYRKPNPRGKQIIYEVCVMDVGTTMPFDTILARGHSYITNKVIIDEI